MPSVVALVAVAPLHTQPTVRAEQCTQLVLGETASVVDRQGDWIRVCTHYDDYDGWVHIGYLKLVDDAALTAWQSEASAWSESAVLRAAGWQMLLPLRARVILENETVMLPDGRRGRVAAGTVRSLVEVTTAARTKPPERWAVEYFMGTPYQWGGVTPWGADCSGVVQTTFAARGVRLPRDAAQQVSIGAVVPPEAIRPGDLLYFRSESGSATITHVAFAGEDDTLVHSTLACGGMIVESWSPGSRGATLMERLVAVRRLEER